MDLHTPKWFIDNSKEKKVKYITSHPTTVKIQKILSDFHLNVTHSERNQVYNTIKNNNLVVLVEKEVSFVDITNLYNQYQFVLSPRGNGIDCHRTWELFLAGAIVITKTSPLDSVFLENNLPVVILNNWEELNENLDEKLKLWYEKYIHLTSKENIFPKMTFNYWMNK